MVMHEHGPFDLRNPKIMGWSPLVVCKMVESLQEGLADEKARVVELEDKCGL